MVNKNKSYKDEKLYAENLGDLRKRFSNSILSKTHELKNIRKKQWNTGALFGIRAYIADIIPKKKK